MSAVARLRVRTARDVLAAPVSAVFRDGQRDAVWVVDERQGPQAPGAARCAGREP